MTLFDALKAARDLEAAAKAMQAADGADAHARSLYRLVGIVTM